MKKILFVLVVFVLTMCSGFVSAYEAEVYKRLGADAPGYYLNSNVAGDNIFRFDYRVKQSDLGTRYDAEIATPHTDYDHFQIGLLDTRNIDRYILCCELLFARVDPMAGPRVPKNWYELAYGDYFSAYINKTDNVYCLNANRYKAEYSPYDWVITFKDDKGNIVAQDVLTGEMYDYFYERSFDEGNYYSSIEFSVTDTIDTDYNYTFYYTIGLSDIRATAVPEPSSLLALAFGGAGTALAAYRRKQR